MPPTAAATVQPATLDQLPVGDSPRIPYVTGRTIVLAPELSVELPSEYREPEWNGLAGRTDGFLVFPFSLDAAGTTPLHLTGDGTITEVDTDPGWYKGHVISPDGRYVAWTSSGDERPTVAKITDLRTGKVIASRELPDSVPTPDNSFETPQILGFDGGEALVVRDDGAGEVSFARWTPADGTLEPGREPTELESIWTVLLSADAMLGIARDGTNDRCLVNVSVARPDREHWRVCDVDAIPFPSLDAPHLALPLFEGTGPDREVRIEIRDLETGDVVVRHEINVPEPINWVPVWESDEALLIVVHDPEGRTPYWLRCPVSAGEPCERLPAPDGGPVTAFAVTRWF